MRHALRAWGRRVRQELTTVGLAARDPRTPWYARALAVAVIAYAASPIDLIPDAIPVLGQLDDLLLVPLGLWLALRLVPDAVRADCRARAAAGERLVGRGGRLAAVAVVVAWLLGAVVLLLALRCRPGTPPAPHEGP